MATVCKLGEAASREQTLIESIKRTVWGSAEVSRFKPFLDSLVAVQKYASNQKMSTVLSDTQLVQDVDGLVKELTFDRYQTFVDMQSSAPPGFEKFFADRLSGKIAAIAALTDDPDAVMRSTEINNDFKNVFKYFNKYKNKANRTLFFGLWNVGSKFKINLCLSNFGNVFKQHPKIYKIYQNIEYITTSAAAATSKYHQHMMTMADNIMKGSPIEDKVAPHELTYLARFMDPSQLGSDAITKDVSAQRIEELQRNAVNAELDRKGMRLSDDERSVLWGHLRSYQEEFNLMNYGVRKTSDIFASKQSLEDYYTALKDPKINKYDTAFNTEGQAYPCLLRMMTVLGNRVNEMIAECPEGVLNNVPTLKTFQNYFTNMGHRDRGGFEIRDNYMPGRGDVFDAMFELGGSGKRNMVYFDTQILQEREALLSPEGGRFNTVDVMTNNLKSLRHMFKKVSLYAGSEAIKHIVAKERSAGATGSETIDDIHNTASYWADKNIENFRNGGEQIPRHIDALKKWSNAILAFQAGTVLTLSGVTNRIAGAMTRALQFGISDTVKMKRDFEEALESTGKYNELAKIINFKFEVYNNQEKISDFLMQMSKKNYTDGLGKLQEYMGEKAPMMVQKIGERMLTHVLGIAKLGSLNFNDSENTIVAIRKHYMFQMAKAVLDRQMAQGELKDSVADIADELFDKLKADVYIKSKEAVGDFSTQAKPFWSHTMMSNADNAGAVILGTAISMGAMFKSVTPVNMDVIHKLTAGLTTWKGTTELGAHDYNKTSAFAIMSIALYSLFEKLLEEDMPMRIYPISNINPFGEVSDVAFGIKALASSWGNEPVTEAHAQHIVDMNKTLLGMISGTIPRVAEDNGNLVFTSAKNFADLSEGKGRPSAKLNPFAYAKDYWEAITSGLFDTESDKYDFQTRLRQNEYAILFNNSNKPLKIFNDTLAMLNYGRRAWVENNPEYLGDAAALAGGELMGFLNATWRVPRDPYRGWDASTRLWTTRSAFKSMSYAAAQADRDERIQLQKQVSALGRQLRSDVYAMQGYQYTKNKFLAQQIRESEAFLNDAIKRGLQLNNDLLIKEAIENGQIMAGGNEDA